MWKERRPQRRHRVCDLVWRRPKLPVPCKQHKNHATAQHPTYAAAPDNRIGQRGDRGSAVNKKSAQQRRPLLQGASSRAALLRLTTAGVLQSEYPSAARRRRSGLCGMGLATACGAAARAAAVICSVSWEPDA
jgi:hypothetical protein